MSAPEQVCDLTELPVSMCAHCRGITNEPERPDPADFGPRFTARLDGWCAGCKSQIEVGDRIRADGTGGYLCAGCGGAS